MRIILLLLLFTLTQPINAQEFSVQNYTDENGLPQNSVKSIAKDNAGFIWFATENGLVRYDGSKFSLFDKNQTKANSNRIITIKKDINNGKLYGLTENWQLIEIKDGKVLANPISFQSVFNFEKSALHEYFFAAGIPSGFENYAEKQPYIIKKKGGFTYKIFDQKISLYHNSKLVYQVNFNYKSIWRFFLLNNELYYLEDDLSLHKFITQRPVKIKLSGEIATNINSKKHQLFWNINTESIFINVNNSLYSIYTKSSGQVSSKKVLNEVNIEKLGVKSIYRNDISGDIYIGTSTKGLFIAKEKQFKTLIGQNNNTTNVFYAHIPFNNGILFTDGHLFEKQNSGTKLNLIAQNSDKYTIAMDRDKNVWTVKDQKVYKLSSNLKTILNTYPFTSTLNTIYIADNQDIWVGCMKGIYVLKKSSKSFSPISQLNEIDSVSYLKKSNEKLWIGTNSGLFSYDIAKQKVHQHQELVNKNIRSIYLRKNETWVTTYGDGFYLIKNNKLSQLPNDKNNYLNAAHCILEDKNGFFWISTNKGIFKTAIADLLAYVNKTTTTVYYSYYDRSAGFNTNEFNGGCQPCGTSLSDGDFIFPSMNGITLFNPSKISNNNPDQPIFFDKIILDNKELPNDKDELEIPNNFNKISIHLSTPYFGNKENLNFEYKLAGQDGWTQSTDKMISFSYLPTGKNMLNIRKLNGYGVNNYTHKNILLIVPVYFYETWWFLTAAVACLFLLIYLYIKLRTKIIRDRNLQLEKSIDESTLELQSTIKAYEFSKNRLDHQSYFQSRLISAITHDIKSPLKYLMMTGEALYKNSSKEIDKEGLEAIYKSSSQIYHFTDNLLQYAKGFTTSDLNTKETFNLDHLITEKIAIFKPIAKNQGTKITNTIAHDVVIKTNQQLLSVILHNLLDNAVKFTSNGEIEFSFTKMEGAYKITVKDTGIGMKAYQVDWCNHTNDSLAQTTSIDIKPSPAGLGLIMVKELNKIINGTLKVSAIESEGTIFEITLAD